MFESVHRIELLLAVWIKFLAEGNLAYPQRRSDKAQSCDPQIKNKTLDNVAKELWWYMALLQLSEGSNMLSADQKSNTTTCGLSYVTTCQSDFVCQMSSPHVSPVFRWYTALCTSLSVYQIEPWYMYWLLNGSFSDTLCVSLPHHRPSQSFKIIMICIWN